LNRRGINTVLILGILSLLSILLIQGYWIQRTLQIQENKRELQFYQDSIDQRQFNERIHLSLRKIAEDISSFNKDSSGLYGDVKQITENYFTVNINDAVEPFLLEQLLKREFYKQSIKESFVYGVYDCFKDSIISGNAFVFKNDLFEKSKENYFKILPQLPPKMISSDGHYFSVYFPKHTKKSTTQLDTVVSPWLYLFAIIIVVLVFFAYAMSVIFKQKRLSEIKNDFINNMTHEFKTPISTIALSSEILLQKGVEKDAERMKQYAEIIYKENKRLENQVERVLNVAKLDKNELKLTRTTVDVHALVQEAKTVFDLSQHGKGGTITLQLNAQNHRIVADEVHFGNVIHNLIDNAIKYCEKQPKIHIRTHDNDHSICIEIVDNGMGISKENQHMVFDQFFRVPTGNIHNVKGFGLGLYYVHQIVLAHKGKISLKSQLGVGTTFKLIFPTA
jgi:two-component system phosphate regulon sensor histidine kinase PhoR